MNGIKHFKDKQKFYSQYKLDEGRATFHLKADARQNLGGELHSLVEKHVAFAAHFEKIHYGCGDTILNDWLNIDIADRRNSTNYLRVDLLEKHPFHDESFSFGFAEDLLEHFGQADSLIFLSEAYRTLRKGGVLRLSFPELEGILKKHYSAQSPLFHYQGKVEAYLLWDHIHFYSVEELTMVAKHIGFREVNSVEYGKSEYKELAGLDNRLDQMGLNTYLELIK